MLLQLLANGIILGSYYSLVSVPLFLFFASTRVLFISLAGVLVVISYVFKILVQVTHTPWLAILGTVPICAVVLLVIFFTVHYPLERRKADPDTHLIASFATLIILEHLVYILIGGDTILLPSGSTVSVGGVTITVLNLVLITSLVFLCFALGALMRSTWLGKALTAAASDLELIQLLGVRPRRLFLLSVAVCSLLLSVVAGFTVLDTGINAYSGLALVLPGLMSLVAGGARDIRSVMIGSMSIGLLSQLVLYFVPTSWQSGLTYSVLLVVMLLKPAGLASGVEWKHEL
jgi:branched-chain amino acid transport system permease protein